MNRSGHLFFNIFVSGILSYLFFRAEVDLIYIVLFMVSSFLGEYYLSPDLDTNSKAHSAWGVFRILWWPYKRFFKHRGSSHDFEGIFMRLLLLSFIGLFLYEVLFLLRIRFSFNFDLKYLAPVFIGLIVSSILHGVADEL